MINKVTMGALILPLYREGSLYLSSLGLYYRYGIHELSGHSTDATC